MREGCTDIIGEVLADVIEVMEFQLVTLVLGLTEVSGCHRYTYPLWTAQVLGQDIVTVLNEVVEVTSQHTVEQAELKTYVELLGTLPCYTIVRILALENTGFTSITEVVIVGNLVPLLLIEEALSHTTYCINVVTNLTVRCTDLQVVQPVFCWLHKLFLSYTPTE